MLAVAILHRLADTKCEKIRCRLLAVDVPSWRDLLARDGITAYWDILDHRAASDIVTVEYHD